MKGLNNGGGRGERVVIFLDITKAFDIVDLAILLDPLLHSGVREIVH